MKKPKCEECKKIIKEDIAYYKGKVVHPNCFRSLRNKDRIGKFNNK